MRGGWRLVASAGVSGICLYDLRLEYDGLADQRVLRLPAALGAREHQHGEEVEVGGGGRGEAERVRERGHQLQFAGARAPTARAGSARTRGSCTGAFGCVGGAGQRCS